VIVPNSELITKPVVNWSLTDSYRRTDIVIGAAYGSDPKLVMQILQELTTKHPDVMKYPEPLITFDQFADSSLNFTVRFWSKLDNRLQVLSELNIQIAEAFAKNGIEIPFPQRDVHLHWEEAAAAELSACLKSRPAKASSSE
jgi:small-conductance mechanosensitive channel